MPTPNELLPLVYSELLKIASAKLGAERDIHSLNATALVHEVWLKLVNADIDPNDRTHFLRLASTAMRQILVDHARAKATQKRGGNLNKVTPDNVPQTNDDETLIALDAALTKLARLKPEHAKLIELRYFAGSTADEAAHALGISPSTGDRMWRFAKAWLQVELDSV